MKSAVPVVELKRAWQAVEAGEFRTGEPAKRLRPSSWTPAATTVAVVGASGRVGASLCAVALATAAEEASRVVECSPMNSTGLAAATTAELGVTATGWRRGTRDTVLIERTTSAFESVEDVPVPEASDCDLTVVDAGWDLNQILRSSSWLGTVVTTVPLMIVTVATIPGLRALDVALQMTSRPGDTWCAVLGPPLKKWPKQLRVAADQRVQAAIDAGRLSVIPNAAPLALSGLTTEPLPPHIVAAATPVFGHMVDHAKGNHHDHR
ncbi:hypothetical protein IFT73_00785 [Aeromicrobium sp. CFBP 8757]|uniref:hypothetical protein n=1 Tax=Aeromicrobium sp. CFBP 8757 TaxID=2775288 RepID=UPI00178007C9|nr:hypothetical protein [Aeromicrobium sp. CFBP 8757]MBD8605373.1 hypothetical protein [Aeromicrobium sp. CFBP 8757]